MSNGQLVITTTVPERLALDCATLAALGPGYCAGNFAGLGNLIAYVAEHSSPEGCNLMLSATNAPGMRWESEEEHGFHCTQRAVRLSLTEDQRREFREWCYQVHSGADVLSGNPDVRLVRAARMVHDWLGWDASTVEVDNFNRNVIKSCF